MENMQKPFFKIDALVFIMKCNAWKQYMFFCACFHFMFEGAQTRDLMKPLDKGDTRHMRMVYKMILPTNILLANVYFRSMGSKVRITAYSKILMIARCFFVIIREAHPFLRFLKSPSNETKNT